MRRIKSLNSDRSLKTTRAKCITTLKEYFKLKNSTRQMDEFSTYVSYLKTLINKPIEAYDKAEHKKRIAFALDGEPNHELQRLVSRSILRKSGAFFTGSKLSGEILKEREFSQFDQSSIIFDPACGAGDLLVSCAKNLSLDKTFKSTLSSWSKQLYGFDIHPDFVLATKLRLALLAISRGLTPDLSIEDIEKSFPKICSGDGLSSKNVYQSASHIIINPPYTKTDSHSCTWATGDVSMAAVFMDECVKNSTEKTLISAILPDVLRSGSRYSKWRHHIESMANIDKIEVVGRFNNCEDIDVFFLHITVNHNNKKRIGNWWKTSLNSQKEKVGNYFKVSVGPVVPHRDIEEGPWLPYIHARTLPRWEVVDTFKEQRRYKGRVFTPPFVAVRRTSSPSDKNRCVGTIISGKNDIAVENHLLVLVPHDKKLTSCTKLLDILKDSKSSEWLNKRIRCRHLTVSALSDLPWLEENKKMKY